MFNVKNLFVILILLCFYLPVQGQEVSQIDTTGFGTLLKVMYKTNPLIEMKMLELNRQKENIFQNKLTFLKNFKLGLQFNQTNSAEAQNAYGIVPRFGFNIQIDFESIFTTRSKIRQAKDECFSAKLDYIQTRTNMKRELFSRFTNFQKAIQSYEIQLEKYRTINDLYIIAQKKFANGEISLDEYSDMVDKKATAKENLLNAELEVYSAKASLMELVENNDGPFKSNTNP